MILPFTRFFAASAAACVLMLAACIPASASTLVDVAVVDRDSGDWLPQHRHRGDAWVVGTPGHRYGVRLTNTTGERVLVVLSVDGVNAISGQTARPEQTGYVLEPWQSTEISGWRKSMEDVAQFVFTDVGDSYAARTGRPHDVGVIGVAVFRESPRHRPYMTPPSIARPQHRERAATVESHGGAASADSAARASAPAQQSIGTGHGAREWAPTSNTHFNRATRSPEQMTQVRYDRYERLASLGVVPRRSPPRVRHDTPSAFPGFVADPPAWH